MAPEALPEALARVRRPPARGGPTIHDGSARGPTASYIVGPPQATRQGWPRDDGSARGPTASYIVGPPLAGGLKRTVLGPFPCGWPEENGSGATPCGWPEENGSGATPCGWPEENGSGATPWRVAWGGYDTGNEVGRRWRPWKIWSPAR